MPACLTGKLSVRSSGPPTASAGVLIMVGAVDGSLLSAVVIGGTADNGLEIAASTIGTMTRSSSAPTTALSAARARALRRGGRTLARADAASGDGHTVGAGLHGRRSSSARSARGMLRGRTAVGPGGSSLALVERAQAAKAADARDYDGADDHDVEVGAAHDEGRSCFAAAATGDGAPAPSPGRRCRSENGEPWSGLHALRDGGRAARVRRRRAAPSRLRGGGEAGKHGRCSDRGRRLREARRRRLSSAHSGWGCAV